MTPFERLLNERLLSIMTTARRQGTSRYMPHQGIEEQRRRREQMKTGEYAPTANF